MPWWNNQSTVGLYWTGRVTGKDITDSEVASVGFYVNYFVTIQLSYAFRYYKKLDQLLANIGGTIFLLFLIFWIPFNFLNRNWQKINNSENLFIDSDFYNKE